MKFYVNEAFEGKDIGKIFDQKLYPIVTEKQLENDLTQIEGHLKLNVYGENEGITEKFPMCITFPNDRIKDSLKVKVNSFNPSYNGGHWFLEAEIEITGIGR